MKKKFEVTGMSCSACQATITRVVGKLDGVDSANVSLLSRSMVVEYDEKKIKEDDIIKAVADSGYGAAPFVNQSVLKIQEKKKAELHRRFIRLIISLVFLVLLLTVSMGGMISERFFSFPDHDATTYPAFVFAQIALEILFVAPIIVLNFHYFISGYKTLFKLHPNMDSLVALGSTVSLAYGLYSFVMIIIGWASSNHDLVMANSMNIYIESAGTIVFFVSLGKYFETRATNKTTSSIADLMSLTPDTAYVVRNEKIEEIETSLLEVGDIVVVKPGEGIPTDGVISEGNGDVDESLLTGESNPVYKKIGDRVIGGSVNKFGSFRFKVTSVGKDTNMSKIVSLVEQASESKAPIARLADRISLIFVPIVIALSLLTLTSWLIFTSFNGGVNVSLSIQLAISVLVISCPCALGLATPVAIMVGTGKGAENGILIKSAEAFEKVEKVDYVLFDKTGTLTKGEMTFHSLIFYMADENSLLREAASLETYSEHPLSKAVVREALSRGLRLEKSPDFVYEPGLGVSGNGLLIGNRLYMENHKIDLNRSIEDFSRLAQGGDTVLYVAKEMTLVGLIALGDQIKDDARATVNQLKRFGKRVALVTGDNRQSAASVAERLGIDEVFSEVLPQEKEQIVTSLQEKGFKVAFVGDGVNDAPSLTRADIGIAIGAGSDVAIDSADIILVHSDPLDVVMTIELSHRVVKNIKENLAWAFLYNIILIPVAAGVLYGVKIFGDPLILTPTIASIAMSLSSVTVVLNALRLRFYKRKDNGKEKIYVQDSSR